MFVLVMYLQWGRSHTRKAIAFTMCEYFRTMTQQNPPT